MNNPSSRARWFDRLLRNSPSAPVPLHAHPSTSLRPNHSPARVDLGAKLRDICLDITSLTERQAREAICVLDVRAGHVIGTGIGESSTVRIPETARHLLDKNDASLRLVHTHPDSMVNVSLSDADVRFLWTSPAASEVEAVLLDGSYFRAYRPSDLDWDRQQPFAKKDLLNMGAAAAAVEDDENPGDNVFYNEVRTHVILQALHDFVLSDEGNASRPSFSSRREYGFRYEYVLSQDRAARWNERENHRLLDYWIRQTRKEFGRIR